MAGSLRSKFFLLVRWEPVNTHMHTHKYTQGADGAPQPDTQRRPMKKILADAFARDLGLVLSDPGDKDAFVHLGAHPPSAGDQGCGGSGRGRSQGSGGGGRQTGPGVSAQGMDWMSGAGRGWRGAGGVVREAGGGGEGRGRGGEGMGMAVASGLRVSWAL